MKTNNRNLFIVLALLAISTFNSQFSTCFAQGTAFTYQGRLNNNGTPANGLYDFRFKLYFDPLGNTQAGSSVVTNAIPAANGLFTVAIDFGPDIFNGSNYWLEVDVKTNNAGSYTVLNPLQPITPTPYAVFANTASNVSGTISSANISGTYGNAVTLNNSANSFAGSFTGNGANVTNVNAVSLNGYGAGNFWQLGGNNVAGGQFLGSTNNQSLAILVAGQRAFLITTNPADSANFVGGSPANVIDAGVEGAVIAGGGTTNFLGTASSNHISANFASVGGGSANWIQPGADHSFIGGGWNNVISPGTYESAIAGGENNINGGTWSMIGGGLGNTNLSTAAFIGSGYQNQIQPNANGSAIVGGYGNTIQPGASEAFIGSGNANVIQSGASESAIGGGYANIIQTNSNNSMIGGGWQNTIQTNNYEAVIGGGVGNMILPFANQASIGGGANNTNGGFISAVAGGQNNTIQALADRSAIAGGYGNMIVGSQVLSVYDFIGGGYGNLIQTNTQVSVISGGSNNIISGSSATIPGGANNIANGNYSLAAGQQAQALHQGAFVWADSQNAPFTSTANDQFLIRAQGGVGINTTNPGGATLAVNTGPSGTILMRNEGDLIPALVTTSSNGYSGWLRFRNVLEVFPNDAGTSSGYVDVRNTNGVTISLDGSTGFVTASNFFGSGASLTALNANNITSGTVPSASIAGTYGNAVTLNNAGNSFVGSYTGNGANLTNVNAATLNGLNATNFWQVGGNNVSAGQFLGSTNNQPVEIHVGGVRAMRVELFPVQPAASNIVNIVNGSPVNFVSSGVYGGTIGGGGAANWGGKGYTNSVTGVFGTVSGGGGNTAGSSSFATVGGGQANLAASYGATVAGGLGNQSSGAYSTVGGGFSCAAGGQGATVPGGYYAIANGQFSFAAGIQAQAQHDGSFVWADYSQFAPFADTTTNQFLIRAQSGVGINTTVTPDGALSINTNTYLFSHPLYLRGEQGSDHNHALAYNGNLVTNFGTGNYQVDGPALWGFGGGLLGTRNGTDNAALVWSTSGVTINGVLSGNGDGLTNLNASQLTSGTVPLTQLPAGVLTNNETTAVTLNGVYLHSDGANNFFAGPSSGGNVTGAGVNNTAIGYATLFNNQGGVDNTALGSEAFENNHTGNENTALGYQTLFASQQGHYNLAIGYQAGNALTTGSSNIYVGNHGVATEYNTIRIGTPGIHTNAVIAGVVTAAGGLQIGTGSTAFTFMESGQAIMPSSLTQETNYTIAFPNPFGSAPKIIFTLANDPGFQGVSDVFASSVSSNSPAAFSINVYRLNGTSWSQSLRVNWQAWQ